MPGCAVYLTNCVQRKDIGRGPIGRKGGLSVGILDVIGVSSPEAIWNDMKTACTKICLARCGVRKLNTVI